MSENTPKRIITPEELVERLREISAYDVESGHMEADRLLCETLRRLGYDKAIDIFESLPKWYA